MFDNISQFGDIPLQISGDNKQTPPRNNRNMINRNLSSNELREWYSAISSVERMNWAIRKGIVYLDANYKFNKRNFEKRTIDEMPSDRRAAIHFRDKECAYCGTDGNLEVDHIIPHMAWPNELLWLANTSSNLVSSCKDCNKSKSYKYMDWSAKNPYPIVDECVACRVKEHRECGSVKAFCRRCREVSPANMCQMWGVDCEQENEF